MKTFSTLPAKLRATFWFLRAGTILFGFCWLLNLIFSFSPFNYFNRHGTVTAGEISWRVDPPAIGAGASAGKPSALSLTSLQGSVVADLGSDDEELVSALHWTLIPSIAVTLIFSYLLFTALRDLCANIESGEIFIPTNLRLIQRIGLSLIFYSLAKLLVGTWVWFVMGNYLKDHPKIETGLNLPGPGVLGFSLPPPFISIPAALLTGALILVLSEAFRQGLALKHENDLTV